MWKPIRKWNRYRSLPGGEPLQYAILFFAVLLGCWPWFRWYDGSVMVKGGGAVLTAWALQFAALELFRLFGGSRETRSES